MNVYDNTFDLSGPGPFVFATPAGAKGFVAVYTHNTSVTTAAASGTVELFLGQSTGSQLNKLADIKAEHIRSGTSSYEGQTAFTLVPSSGATGILKIKFTTEDQPEASYAL